MSPLDVSLEGITNPDADIRILDGFCFEALLATRSWKARMFNSVFQNPIVKRVDSLAVGSNTTSDPLSVRFGIKGGLGRSRPEYDGHIFVYWWRVLSVLQASFSQGDASSSRRLTNREVSMLSKMLICVSSKPYSRLASSCAPEYS